jgi:hypothetical protein
VLRVCVPLMCSIGVVLAAALMSSLGEFHAGVRSMMSSSHVFHGCSPGCCIDEFLGRVPSNLVLREKDGCMLRCNNPVLGLGYLSQALCFSLNMGEQLLTYDQE